MVFFSICSFYVSSVLCYNHSNSINSSLLHLPKTWIVSNSFTTIRGSTLQANMSGVEFKKEKRKKKKKKRTAFMSQCDLFKWDLEQESKILLSCMYCTSFFIIRREILVCVGPETGLQRIGKELRLCRSKEYKPWSLHPSETCMCVKRDFFFLILLIQSFVSLRW